ncbi:dCMP deaminase family protein [Acidaminobacter sp. JC074]|uniref:deoxycytidylate deaminase n=1 Tax=Acidaminobacter sp. JC074 TaxID=2530199 RepID=UPI001F0E5106|nr:dCMP deaminase family protein [Acidaminobacter sp. JC074]MCH4889612.1 dCMP deaminase family protein [Acidaminobacter sp. JC074]
MNKRKDYISWDEYFLSVALVSAMRSKDPNTQVGACIVDNENKIVSIGYNGFPVGCSDDELPWDNEGGFLETKYAFSCHAELNAILNSSRSNLKGCSVYTTLFPCNECAKAIIQSGISEIVYLSDKYADTDIVKASKLMLNKSGVKLRKFESTREGVFLSFDENDV